MWMKLEGNDAPNSRENMIQRKTRFLRNELADVVIDQFGKDIMMIPCDDSHFIITAPIEISPPFFAWVATFGRRVKILSPEPVVEKMRDFLQRSMDMYKEEG